jgi:hypothetical protein
MSKKVLISLFGVLVIAVTVFGNQNGLTLNYLSENNLISHLKKVPSGVSCYLIPEPKQEKQSQNTQDTLSHHDDPYYYFHAKSCHASRFTMPTPTATPCTLLATRHAILRLANTNPTLCSVFVFRDTIFNSIHKPGQRIFTDTFTVPTFSTSSFSWFTHDISFARIAFNAGENFWVGCQIADTADPCILLDATINPDTTMNEYDSLPPAGPPEDWLCNIYVDYLQEAVISYRLYDNDVGITWLNLPGYVITNVPKSITVKIKNYGSETQTSIPVSYDPGDGSAGSVSETWTGSIATGESTFYTFTQSWTPTTTDTVNFKVWTALSSDEILEDDTIAKEIQIFPPCPSYHTPPYTENFDENWGSYGDVPPYCGWQIVDNGNENPKVWNTNDWCRGLFYSRTVAAVTNYPTELQDEWLISPRLNCSVSGQYSLNYWHYYHGENTSPDRGYVLLSIDGGSTWDTITKYIGGNSAVRYTGYVNTDISTLARGQSDVRIAFRYVAYNAFLWCIDDFEVDFTPAVFLNITIDGNGNVTKVPDRSWYTPGTTVTLTAQPVQDWRFDRWSGNASGSANSIDIMMDSDKDITAHFIALPPSQWVREADVLSPSPDTLKAVSDGGALVAVQGSKSSSLIYAFHGNKSNRFYQYTPVVGAPGTWLEKDSLKFRNKKIPPLYQADKKYPAAGAALAYDEADGCIYATKGGSTRELWVFAGDTWHLLGGATDTLPQTKGIKNGSSLVYNPADEKLYLLAGLANKKDTNTSFASYTPSTHTWTTLPRLPLETPVPPTDKRPLWADGSCLVLCNGTFYALRTTSKQGLIYKYDGAWHYLDSVPYYDTLSRKPTGAWVTKKINLPKAGTAMASNDDDNIIYMIKGNGSTALWKYTPGLPSGTGWSTRVADTIPNWGKMKGVKNGAALTYLNGKLFLLRGNKTRQFWCYVPSAVKSEERIANSAISVLASQSNTVSNVSPMLDVFPNPFTKMTTIRYMVPVSGRVLIKLYNTMGKLVETLIDEYQNTGSHILEIRNTILEIPKGIYFLHYQADRNIKETKLIVE